MTARRLIESQVVWGNDSIAWPSAGLGTGAADEYVILTRGADRSNDTWEHSASLPSDMEHERWLGPITLSKQVQYVELIWVAQVISVTSTASAAGQGGAVRLVVAGRHDFAGLNDEDFLKHPIEQKISDDADWASLNVLEGAMRDDLMIAGPMRSASVGTHIGAALNEDIVTTVNWPFSGQNPVAVGERAVHSYQVGRISHQRDSGSQAHMHVDASIGGYDKMWFQMAYQLPNPMQAQPTAVSFKAKLIANLYEVGER